nr:MAG TPA: hypothetical protein [Ackermannviridae sp.]
MLAIINYLSNFFRCPCKVIYVILGLVQIKPSYIRSTEVFT